MVTGFPVGKMKHSSQSLQLYKPAAGSEGLSGAGCVWALPRGFGLPRVPQSPIHPTLTAELPQARQKALPRQITGGTLSTGCKCLLVTSGENLGVKDILCKGSTLRVPRIPEESTNMNAH